MAYCRKPFIDWSFSGLKLKITLTPFFSQVGCFTEVLDAHAWKKHHREASLINRHTHTNHKYYMRAREGEVNAICFMSLHVQSTHELTK